MLTLTFFSPVVIFCAITRVFYCNYKDYFNTKEAKREICNRDYYLSIISNRMGGLDISITKEATFVIQ